jgi:murein DD-endopeptidase MepM/ murein hydrolase activator NlpD
LAFKKTTIVLFPDGSNKVKQIRIPKFLPVLFVFILVSSVALISWIIRDYRMIKPQMSRLAQLQKENEQQKRQFVHLKGRISQLTQKMVELQEFDHRLKVMVNLDANDENAPLGVGGSDPKDLTPDYSTARTHRDLVRVMHRSLDTLDNEIDFDKEDKAQLQGFLEKQKKLLASTPSIWPTKGWLSSRFSYRFSPFTGRKEFHKGIDVSTRMGAPIIAPANGVVAAVRWDHLSGKVLAINHGYGLVTKYAHLSKALVKKGQYVKRGETIALVGNTGRSTGPHLHYEVHLNKVATNPLRYILN